MEFRKIPSLFNLYEINEDGTIFRNVKTGKELKIKLDMHHSDKGYYTTFVHFGGRKPENYCKRVMIHRVVAECWIGECPEGMQVDHIDRNSHNNHYTNLRYVTHSEQMKNRDHTNISRTGFKNLEIARKERMKPVKIINNTIEKTFESFSSCARFLENELKIPWETIRYYLRKKKNKIKDYDIIYLT